MTKLITFIAAAVVTVAAAPPANAVPVVGGNGLTPNAWNVVQYVRDNFPGVQSIGGVRACDWVGEHCSGRAVDVMVGGNASLGTAVNNAVRGLAGVKYTLWQVANHYDHVHVGVY
jgi:hypothetical protein